MLISGAVMKCTPRFLTLRSFGLAAIAAVAWALPALADPPVEVPTNAVTMTVPVVSSVESPAEAMTRPMKPVTRMMKIRAGTATQAPVFAPIVDGGASTPMGGLDDTGDAGSKPNGRENRPYIGNDFTSFPGLGFGGAFPPDPTIAVGPNHIVISVNSEVGAFRKDGTKVWSMPNEQFFASVNTGSGDFDFTSDPKVFFDFDTNKFFYVVLGLKAGGSGGISESRLLIAASTGADVNTATDWLKFSFTSTLNNSWSDYPGWGCNKDTLYCTGNYFGTNSGQPAGTNLWIFPKSQFGGFRPPNTLTFTSIQQVTGLDGGPAFTLQPVVTYDLVDGRGRVNDEYMVSAQQFSGNRIFVYQVNGLTSPNAMRKLSVNVQPYTQANGASGRGTPFADTLDTRLFNAVRVGDTIWCSHDISGPNGNAACRWYQIRIDNFTQVSLAQQGNIQKSNGHAWLPGICANVAGDAVVFHTEISDSEFPSMYYSYRLCGDPVNTMRSAVLARPGTGGYIGFRWGDYCTPALDPSDSSTIWGYHMYSIPQFGGVWSTQVVRVPLNPPQTDCSGGGGGSAPPPCSTALQVVSPVGNENWVTGSKRQILWNYQGNDDDLVDIFLVKGNAVSQIAKGVPAGVGGAGSFEWTVGNLMDSNVTITTSDTYRILLRPNHCDSPIAQTPGFFTITLSVVANAAPPGAVVPADSTIKTVEIGVGESVVLGGLSSDGQIAVAQRGKAPYTYRWSPTDFLDNSGIPRPTSKPLRTITYTLEVRDSTGTIASDQVTVKIGNPLRIDAGPNKAFRPGNTVVLEGTATGGAPPYSYQWSPTPDPTLPTGLDGVNVAQPSARPTQPTIYTLKVTDTAGTVQTDTVAVVPGIAVSIINNPGNAGSVIRNIVKDLYMSGEKITVEAVPNAGYLFDHWEKPGAEFNNRPADPNAVFNENPTTFTFQTSDARIEAVFRLITIARPPSSTPAGSLFPGLPFCGTSGVVGMLSMLTGLALMRRSWSRRRR